MAAIDINRLTAGVILTPEQSNEIWTETTKQSAVVQLARRVSIPGAGVDYQTLGDSTPAGWVGETEEKPAGTPTFGSKKLRPYKLAKIIPVSMEFMRDKAQLWNEVRRKAAEGFAETIDKTFLTGDTNRPITDGMDTLSDAQQVGIGSGTYADFVKIATTVMENGGDFNGIALSAQGQSRFISATDANGRPLLVPNFSSNDLGTMFGARIVKSPWGYKSGSPNILGVAGDFRNEALYGVVSGITMRMSTEATIKVEEEQVNLWQRNMAAILLEMEVGFIVKNKKRFVVITDKAGK